MPAPKKPLGTQQGHYPVRALTVVDGDRPVPAVPPGLLVSSQERWAEYWRSHSAGATDPADFAVAERWVFAYDEWRRALNAVRRKRTVPGSTGQPTMNPLAQWASSREQEMHRCEAELGIGPKSRLNLGITVGQARLTAAELNRITEESDGDNNDTETAELLEQFQGVD